MDWLDSLFLGVVQGLAEYLPISSSGHLEICRDLLHMDLNGAQALQFDVTLHVATVLSTLVVLWKEFVPLCRSFFGFKRDENTMYVWKLLLSCIPVLFVGLLLKDKVEALFGGSLVVVGVCLLVTAALLTFAYYFRRADRPTGSVGANSGRDITFVDAFVIGIAQAVAVLPGLSRSGSTIATGLLLGNKRAKLAQFSFFMVVIPILGEALLDIMKMLSGHADAVEGASIGIVPLIVGFVSAFIVGCLACRWMINLVKKGKLVWFAVYCAVVGLICLIF
jgi:undecaprenyl-diphosphatase